MMVTSRTDNFGV